MSNENFVSEDYHFQIAIYFVDLFLYFKICLVFRTCGEFQLSTFYLNENQFEILCDPSISTFVVSVY